MAGLAVPVSLLPSFFPGPSSFIFLTCLVPVGRYLSLWLCFKGKKPNPYSEQFSKIIDPWLIIMEIHGAR